MRPGEHDAPARRLPGSVFFNQSTCVNNAEAAYFLHGTLPAKGTACQQNSAPFAPGP
jgi:TAP-like protein